MHEALELVHTLRHLATSFSMYGSASGRVLLRSGLGFRTMVATRAGATIFVVGSPRSGTSFLATALGAQPGCVDLGEVTPLKAAIPALFTEAPERAAARVRSILERVRRLGRATRLRGVEQTPETAFVLDAALRAYPHGSAVHIVRDGRDVVCSLLERGWLNAARSGVDDARLPYGQHARYWVEPGREEEFAAVSDARRAAWAWRRYVTEARKPRERVLEIRYEDVVGDPGSAAELLATHLDLQPGPLSAALGAGHDRSVGRWRRDLTAEQLADVEAEAGGLLAELGYD